ncbi:MAG: DUF1549 and DUF1553 domain-containing protein, partial [Armatimonadota bacterium]|nr:DUF1549 and DUF1553 domain-containing protein [Armatimonadota bacterium]
ILLTAILSIVWAWALSQNQNEDINSVINEINAIFERYWKERFVKPSPLATDAEFLRRVYLDLTGNLPPEEVTRQFLADKSQDKRSQIVEQLLSSQEYSQWWATVWRIWLIGRESQRFFVNAGARSMEQWLQEKLAENLPYNRWVYDLLTSSGRTDENGSAFFFVKYEAKPEELAGAISRIFLGTQIQCAQCHDAFNDPRWKQQDFWSIAAYFARVRIRPVREQNRIVAFEVFDAPRGEAVMERNGQRQVVMPKFVFASLDLPERPINRRDAFAQYLTHPQNRLFAQAVVNRYWAYFFGRGLVHPVDDFSPENPPAIPEVLEKLTEDFIQNGYDLKRLIRIIVSTKAYQLSCQSNGGALNSPEDFAQAQLRPLMPEQLFNAFLRATGAEEFLKEWMPRFYEQLQQFMVRRFVLVFNTDEEPDVTAFEQTIQQALMLMNNEQVQRAVRLVSGLPMLRNLTKEVSDEEFLNTIFLRFYCRYPTDDEKRVFLDYVRQHSSNSQTELSRNRRNVRLMMLQVNVPSSPRLSAFEDIAWALLNSGEFLFNH